MFPSKLYAESNSNNSDNVKVIESKKFDSWNGGLYKSEEYGEYFCSFYSSRINNYAVYFIFYNKIDFWVEIRDYSDFWELYTDANISIKYGSKYLSLMFEDFFWAYRYFEGISTYDAIKSHMIRGGKIDLVVDPKTDKAEIFASFSPDGAKQAISYFEACVENKLGMKIE